MLTSCSIEKKYLLLFLLILFGSLLVVVDVVVADSPDIGDQETISVDGVAFNMRLAPGMDFPTGISDSGSETVNDNFWIAETPVTYELWTKVRDWAEGKGYTFANQGQRGAREGEEPFHLSSFDEHPVTNISWRDTIVWCNALTEYLDEFDDDDLVYFYGDPLTKAVNATDISAFQDLVHYQDRAGFRLPTSDEWELAARYQGSDDSNGAIEYPSNSGNYWTPGNYASGSTGLQKTDIEEVAWYYDHEEHKESTGYPRTKDVGDEDGITDTDFQSNALGLYDMSGNVWEWCFCASGTSRIARGGSFFSVAGYLQIGHYRSGIPDKTTPRMGFRIARSET